MLFERRTSIPLMCQDGITTISSSMTNRRKLLINAEQFNLPIDDVPRDLLRMEIVFVERTLDKLFKSKKTLSDVLTQKNLIEIIREYKRVFCDELVDGMIKPYVGCLCS